MNFDKFKLSDQNFDLIRKSIQNLSRDKDWYTKGIQASNQPSARILGQSNLLERLQGG